ncbi:MAG: hypothetical protein SCALA702_10380 [Melioribacteraceae bacterium]|nr:MAG: hypothetical protein SCALA702_10380 [Melioribacteraceae bacterium]
MHSSAETVTEYINSFDPEYKDVLNSIRDTFLQIAPEAEESMKYKMPTYMLGEKIFAFAVQKYYISVYVSNHKLISEHSKFLGKNSHGKSCIRFSKPEHINLDGLKNLLTEVYS